MECKTEFNLAGGIARWRASLTGPELSAEAADELESHLFDEIDTLRAIGLDDEEAFMVAAKRLGHAEVLVSEFGKVHGTGTVMERLVPYITGVLALLAFVEITRVMNDAIFLIATQAGLSNVSYAVLALGAFIACCIIIAALFYSKLKRWKHTRVHKPIPVLIAVVLVCRTLSIILNLVFAKGIATPQFTQKFITIGVFNSGLFLLFLLASFLVFLRVRKRRRVQVVR